MEIKTYLNKRIKLIDREFEKYLPPASQFPEKLHKAMRHSIFAGGKRIRPIIMLETAELLGCDINKVLPTACAIELIHTGSLILDDMPSMDNAATRRGKLCCHKAFDEHTALLAAYAMSAKVGEIISKTEGVDSDILVKVSDIISKAVGSEGMAGGQQIDLDYGKKFDKKIVEYVYLNKTARLFMAAVESASLIAGATEEQKTALVEFAKNFGIAFQIRDDILDVTAKKEDIGKDVKKDMGKPSIVTLCGIDTSKKLVEEYLGKASKNLKIFYNKSGNIKNLLNL